MMINSTKENKRHFVFICQVCHSKVTVSPKYLQVILHLFFFIGKVILDLESTQKQFANFPLASNLKCIKKPRILQLTIFKVR